MNEKMIMFSIRLESKTIEDLNIISKMKYLPMRTMVRSWIMERLENELKVDYNGKKIQ